MDYLMNCTDIVMNNSSSSSFDNSTYSDREMIHKLDKMCNGVIIPVLCAFGFVGNILNVIIFTQKKSSKILDEVEYCTTICLVALAISDMMFCFTTFPIAFLPAKWVFDNTEFMLYYKMYNTAIISTFIMSSTLMTVLTAMMRYFAICHPFRSRQCITIRSTITAIVIAYLISFAFNIPKLWRFKTTSLNNCLMIENLVLVKTGDLHKDKTFVYAYKILWAIFGNFIPLIVLIYCNIRLIKALHMSKQLHLLHSRDDTSCLSAHRRINITLITIIILFFILVAPSEITKFIFYIMKEHDPEKYTYTFQVVSIVTNTLQSINFSVNFILYYVIIAPFRKTLHEFVCAFTRPKRNTMTHDRSSNSGKQTVVLLSIRDRNRL